MGWAGCSTPHGAVTICWTGLHPENSRPRSLTQRRSNQHHLIHGPPPQLMHELAHAAVAGLRDIKIAPSFLIPNSQLGTFGSVTQASAIGFRQCAVQ